MEPCELIEIKFKGQRRQLFKNPKKLSLQLGELAVVEAEKGEDMGKVNLIGAKLGDPKNLGEIKTILRKPSKNDLAKYYANKAEEKKALEVCKEKVKKHRLNMNLIDCEFQLDKNRITFYFTSENRVDFRELVKDLARIYKTRIELRQIGVRDASCRLGGYGICGRPLCCSSWLRDFKPIPIQSAKDQSLPLSAAQLAGLCGRLKCCLIFERDLYNEAIKKFPQLAQIVITEKGEAQVEHIDVFKEEVVLKFKDDHVEKHSINYLKDKLYNCDHDCHTNLEQQEYVN